ncbi:transcription repressor OFP7 [Benincasa hispida]|uniref:transcription repressor OFP7 n=1 Tax=Benincasa hispida TaxID=102211 RepID=UPI00190025AA|nr:transcription repressor OFP7 [Benincasa hispida]
MMMAKRFKLLRIPSFHCCRSNDISVVPTDPPSSLPPPKPHRSSLRRHVSSAFKTATCGCRSSSTNSDDDQISKSSPTFPTHVPPTPLLDPYDDVFALPKRRRRRRKKKFKSTTLAQLRISTSSAESGLFSSESFDENDQLEETETLISSSKTMSSTDDDNDSSSQFNPQLETIREKPYKTKNKNNLRTNKEKEKRHRSSNRRQKQNRTIIKTSPSPEIESPARLSVFQRLIPCTVEGKIRESFAVVKKSADPFEDFKRSMMEMIMEKEMFDEKDLEQLLHCLLSLNDREHHGIIVEAFSEIWQSLFCN